MIIEEIIDKVPITYERALTEALASAPEGIFCEFGISTGHHTKNIARLIHPKIYYGFDSFEGLPEDWKAPDGSYRDRKGAFKCEPPTDLGENVQLIIGMFQETLSKFLHQNNAIAFAHLDADLYSSTIYVLNTLKGHLASGAILMFDQCTRDEFCLAHEGRALQEFADSSGYTLDCIGRQKRDGAIFRVNG